MDGREALRHSCKSFDELMPVELGDEFLRVGDALLLLQPLQFAFRRDF
jgi:hypothetical protein